MDVTCLVFSARLFSNASHDCCAGQFHMRVFICNSHVGTDLLRVIFRVVMARIQQPCHNLVGTDLLRYKVNRLVTAGLNNLLANCYRLCYNLVGHNIVMALFQQHVSMLSRATSQQPVQTQPDLDLTEQHCNNTVAGLLQVVHF